MTIKEFEIQYALGTLTDGIKLKLAGNNRTSKKILTILSTDKDDHIRWWVAENPNAPKEVLTKLSTDKDNYVRSCVAYNPNTPEKIKLVMLDGQP